jgi:hypothetical protein
MILKDNNDFYLFKNEDGMLQEWFSPKRPVVTYRQTFEATIRNQNLNIIRMEMFCR